jgi:hypothetical protein
LPVLTISSLVEHAAGTPKRSLLSRVLPRLRRRQPISPTYGVVRSDVSQVGSLGVKYIAAAVFERPFQILDPQGSRREAEPSHFSLAVA